MHGKESLWVAFFAICGVALLVVAGLKDVRYELDGLQAVSGKVIEAESRKQGRQSGYTLYVTLETGGRRILLRQDEVGGYAYRLAAGQLIRAWIDPQAADADNPPTHTVWQIERAGQVIMPVMEVGDELQDQMMWEFLMGGFVLACGLFLAARNWLRANHEAPRNERESKP